MVYLTRKEHFNAAHKLHNPDWTLEKNKEVFGKCANHNWHGHNYEIWVTVKGEPDPETGFVFNAHHLSALLQREIISKVDHKNLNVDVDFMQGILPSTENFIKEIWKQLEPNIKGCSLHCIKLAETDKIYAEYYGE